MVTLISQSSLFIYQRIARPILFRFSADNVHSFITTAGVITQAIPGLSSLLRFMWRYDNPRLEQTVAGIHFKNPIGLSAGFDKEARLPKLLSSVGFGLAEVGSITARAYAGNEQPWYSRLPYTKSILVNSGLRSTGVVPIAERADRKLAPSLTSKMPINASVARTNGQSYASIADSCADYCQTLQRLESSNWPALYTINISCPNTSGGEPFNKPANLAKLLKSIDELVLSRPVFLKLPINLPWSQIDELLKVAQDSSITGVTIGNLSKDRSLVDPRDKLSQKQPGHLSGKPCWQASNQLIAHTYAAYGQRFIIIGVGGVFSARDAYTKIRLGSSLVELITGMIYQGPALIGSINKQLVKFVEQDGYSSVSEAIGVDAKKYLAKGEA